MRNMELAINGINYEFKFGFGFMRELDSKIQIPVSDIPGKKEKIGFKYSIAQVLDGNVEELLTVLYTANKGMNPRIKISELEEYIESDECDVDKLFEQVIDFLSKTNVSKKAMRQILQAMKENEEKTEK